MLKIYQYLKSHLKEDFQGNYYLSVILLWLAFIFLNQTFSISRTLGRWALQEHNPWVIPSWIGLYSLAYYGTMALYTFLKKDKTWFSQSEFWLKSGLVIVVMSLYTSSWLHSYTANLFVEQAERFFASRISIILQLNIAMLLPVVVFYFWKDRKMPFLYGLTLQGFDYRAYLPIVLLIIPAVAITATSPHFLEYYPVCKPTILRQLTQINGNLAIALYEFLYAHSFVGTEALFRGLLVVGMSKILGKNAILPMCSFYCLIHFSKPLGEVILSAPGGYILGVLAYRTQNIIGGIWVHLTMAMGMELFGALM